jgi:hypothetical protein
VTCCPALVLVTLACGAALSATDTAPVRAYADVNAGLRDAVEALALPSRQDGLPTFAGVAPGLFAPGAPLTRAEGARLLQRALLPLRIPRSLGGPARQ